MSVSPCKRSASVAQLSDCTERPNKSARKSMSKTVSKRKAQDKQEPGVGERWLELGRSVVGTSTAFGGALCATATAGWNAVRNGFYVFGNVNELLLPLYRSKAARLLPPPSSPVEKTSTCEPTTLKPPPAQTNHCPTNLHASSSTSASSFRPPPESVLASSSSTSTSDVSHVSGIESTSSQTSLPNGTSGSAYGFESTQTDSIRRVINQTNTEGLLNDGVVKRYKRRSHIYEAQHRQRVKEYLERELYERTRAMGYQSDFQDFRGYVSYRRRVAKVQRQDWQRLGITSISPTPILPQDDMNFFQRAIDKAQKSLQSPKPPKPYSPTLEELTARTRFKNERIFNRLHPKRKPLPDRLPNDAEWEVKALMQKRGVLSKTGREQVSDTDLVRLMPGQWLNDEIINFYGQLISNRAAEAEAAKENQKGNILNVHYFSTFFWPKLQSGYDKGRLAKWTKKVDIFSKDIVLMAINHGNSHWTSAAIDFRRKRIISYDSMGFYRAEVYKALRMYLNEEHKNKKKKPFDFTGWEDYRSDTYPGQENGYDCGVFTCQTLEYLSRGEEEFNFTQQNMPYLRQRMTWEIGRAKLGDSL